MPYADGFRLIEYGLQKDEDDKLYLRWVGAAQYQMSFDEFKRQLKNPEPKFKDEDELFDDLEKIMNSAVKEKNGNI